jgi:4-hydroxybenzoate polyprenyltransferase
VVGRLALVAGQNTTPARPGRLLAAAASVYLSYGAGMAMNDCADVDADALHEIKQDRAIASGRISKRAGWTYCIALSLASFLFATRVGTFYYSLWTVSNLICPWTPTALFGKKCRLRVARNLASGGRGALE